MADVSETFSTMRDAFMTAVGSFVSYLPWLIAALLVLLIGWRVARLLRTASMKAARGLNTLLRRFGTRAKDKGRSATELTPVLVRLIGNIVFWLTILVSITLAARIAQLDMFTEWLSQIVTWLPAVLVGGLILLAGFLVSTVARDTVSAALESTGSQQSEILGLAVQIAIFTAAMVIGLNQVGIDVSFLTTLFGVIVGGVLLGISLAFGLGARVYVSNILGAHQARDQLERGQTVRIGDIEGQVIEFTSTAVILATESGRLSIPAKAFQDEATLIVADDDDE